MPSIGLMAGSVLIKSFLLWLIASSYFPNEAGSEVEGVKKVKKDLSKKGVVDIGIVIIVSHLIGVLTLFTTSNKTVHDYFSSYGIPTPTGIFYLMLTTFVVSFLSPKFLKVHHSNSEVNICIVFFSYFQKPFKFLVPQHSCAAGDRNHFAIGQHVQFFFGIFPLHSDCSIRNPN